MKSRVSQQGENFAFNKLAWCMNSATYVLRKHEIY